MLSGGPSGFSLSAQASVPQILAMAQALELKIVVEGVESEEQAAYLASVDNAIQAQGWLFGRPIPAQEMRARL